MTIEKGRELFANIMSELGKRLQPDPGLHSQAARANLRDRFDAVVKDKCTGIGADLLARVEREFFGDGPLCGLLTDASVTEILVNGPTEIWVERNGLLEKHDDQFYSPLSYQNFIHRMSAEAGMEANLERPAADGRFRDFRAHLVVPPVAVGHSHLSLRRQNVEPWTLNELERVGWAKSEATAVLRKLIRDRRSFLIAGGTSSGKTSVLNACLHELQPQERVVAIEDTPEIRLPNQVSAGLLTRNDAGGILPPVDQSELLKQALRMRPDRIVVGEVRGAEAKDLLMALSTGHEGGMGTLHADNARQALLRLEMLIQLGAPQWSVRAIRHLILLGVYAVVVVKKDRAVRRLEGIHRITSLEETGFCLERMV